MVYKLSLCLCLLSVLCTASTIPMEYRSQPSEYRQEYGQAVSIVHFLSFVDSSLLLPVLGAGTFFYWLSVLALSKKGTALGAIFINFFNRLQL